jgi:hypothetical protein
MGIESYLVLWVVTDECCHPNRFRVELMLIENFEIGSLDFPNRDTLEPTHCFLPNVDVSDGAGHQTPESANERRAAIRSTEKLAGLRIVVKSEPGRKFSGCNFIS